MRVVLQMWCQIQRTSSSSCYVYCGPRHLQCICSSGCSGFNIKLNVSALLVDTCRHFSARYTANLLPNIAHILQFTLCDLWSRTFTMDLQLRISTLQYSIERICAAIGNISTIRRALYCKICAKYSARPPA
jgi:hypothetical protein